MSRPETEELLRDARLVIDYAARIGKLPDDELPKAMHTAEEASNQEAGPHLVRLLAALNSGVRAIAPMTLVELRAGHSPFDPRNQRATRRLQICFCVVTIALTVMVASFTEYLHRGERALKALQQIQDTHPLDKLNALRRMVRFEKVLDHQTAINYDQYHRSIRELRELQDKLSGGYELLNNVAENAPWSFAVRLFRGSLGYTVPAEALAKTVTDESDECDSEAQATLRNSRKYAAWLQGVIADLVEEICFAQKTNLLLSLPRTSGPVYQIQASMAALSGWVLPFLYGLLGASVFVMRDLLNLRTPTLGFFPTLLRVALGGIAGIIIGWFWIPTAIKAADVASLSSVPFGLAFLTGFSIDVLFSLLDRLNRTITDTPTTVTGRTAATTS
jgi:spore maturation protein SpmA